MPKPLEITKEDIENYIRANPGTTLKSIAKAFNMGMTSAKKYVEKFGLRDLFEMNKTFRNSTGMNLLIKKDHLISVINSYQYCTKTMLAKHYGVNIKTILSYLDKYGLNDLMEQKREEIIDFAESQLIKKISDGDTTAIIFFLKTIGRNRGYSEKANNQLAENMIIINNDLRSHNADNSEHI